MIRTAFKFYLWWNKIQHSLHTGYNHAYRKPGNLGEWGKERKTERERNLRSLSKWQALTRPHRTHIKTYNHTRAHSLALSLAFFWILCSRNMLIWLQCMRSVRSTWVPYSIFCIWMCVCVWMCCDGVDAGTLEMALHSLSKMNDSERPKKGKQCKEVCCWFVCWITIQW